MTTGTRTFICLAAGIVACCCTGTPNGTAPSAEVTVLFSSADSTDGTDSSCNQSVPYRIPALAETGGGRLLAVADYRHCRRDIGYGRVDLHSRSSSDNGRSWDEERTIIEGSGVSGAADCGFGDAALVCDRESGELLLMAVCGQTVYSLNSTNRQNPNRIAELRSSDGGVSWSSWEEKTEDIYSLFDGCGAGCVESCFVTSGKIFQSRSVKVGSHYRIYAALCARPNGNRVIYSDDFGRSWKALGGPDAMPAPYGDEAKCEELPDGSVILSSRAYEGRIFNIFRYDDTGSGEGVWGEPAWSYEGNMGCAAKENACNGELIVVKARRCAKESRRGTKGEGRREEVLLALQSLPLGPGRANVGIYFKEINTEMDPASLASGWSGPYRLSEKESAYSAMIQLSDGRIALFWEEGPNADCSGYGLCYSALSLSQISGGLYRAL